ncbi:putative outer membrane protein containing OmpA/MotB domain [endosymbiont of Tevnia jerichonana (vent Tica)]|uniref:Putative outer membrane protein containing OmpA/MotB domain n=1 Tax=endosymbiont of Tevnia jerichonana (vent Tica) TaxID=1049564 RepID=G2FI45_9GAMM|nr:putative outer membrane protein containing OmpA/MotB domain [endosymbiont of Tevnia jerichonana (vent Tica)]
MIFFDTAKATLKPKSKAALEPVLNLLNNYPDLVLEVAGHTDSQGKAKANLDLSNHRAASVRRWLLEHGVQADRLLARGYGEDHPVADNGTSEGRAKNRRVELIKKAGGKSQRIIALLHPYPGSVLLKAEGPVEGDGLQQVVAQLWMIESSAEPVVIIFPCLALFPRRSYPRHDSPS